MRIGIIIISRKEIYQEVDRGLQKCSWGMKVGKILVHILILFTESIYIFIEILLVSNENIYKLWTQLRTWNLEYMNIGKIREGKVSSTEISNQIEHKFTTLG